MSSTDFQRKQAKKSAADALGVAGGVALAAAAGRITQAGGLADAGRAGLSVVAGGEGGGSRFAGGAWRTMGWAPGILV